MSLDTRLMALPKYLDALLDRCRLTILTYSAAGGRFSFWAEFLNFLEYFSIYVSHDPNFLPLDRAMSEQHFSYLGHPHI